MSQALAALPPGFEVACAALLGLAVGSFLNVVVYRLPRGESVVRPRSRCPRCERPLPFWENVPVLSWLWLRGRCRGCGGAISWRYPAVELATAALFAAIAWRHGLSPMTPVWFAFAAALLAAALIDFDHRIIPDEISLGGLALALVAVPGAEALAGLPFGARALRALAGALLGGGSLWLVGFAHARVSQALGRRFPHWPGEGEAPPRPGSLDWWTWFPGIGFGDVKLLALIGAVLGPAGVLEAILAAACLGLALGLAGGLWRRRFDVPFGFGPALAAGALAVLLAPGPLFPWLSP
jgi:leader peptidase (prepilin peptidase)/N-methyltransferase